MKKYIIFDFDGTVANTNGIIIDSWQAAFKKYLGHTISAEEIEKTFGETIEYTIKHLLPDTEWTEVRDFFRAYQKNECKVELEPFDGVEELLMELKKRGYVMAIATSRTCTSYRTYIGKLGYSKYFDVEITMEDVSAHKPDPECMYAAMDKLGATADECLMIGDTRFDIGCAYNAGIDSVLIKWSHAIGEMNWQPTYEAETPADILRILENHTR